MQQIEGMRIFVRVADLASFTQAAESMGLPKASISAAVKNLEQDLGTRLLQRTTRTVKMTPDGELFYERAKDLLSDFDELQQLFVHDTVRIRGRLRVDLPSGIARNIVLPQLPGFLKAHPELELELSSTDRRVDVVREGFDCVLRIGQLHDSNLVARQLGVLPQVNCASPAYLQEYGTPNTPADLAHHRLVFYASQFSNKVDAFEYQEQQILQRFTMQGSLTVNSSEAYQAACLAGLGIIQAPRIGAQALLEQGKLVEILPQYQAPPMPMHLIYANRRQVAKRTQIFMQWLSALLEPYLQNR